MSLPETTVIPASLAWIGDRPMVHFAEVACEFLDLPFMEQALARGRIVKMSALDDYPREIEPAGIAGTVHHISRCGSTLVARQFGVLPSAMVLSEPVILSQLMGSDKGSSDQRARRLRRLLAMFQDGGRSGARLVVKWPLYLSCHAAEIEAALPGVPSLFLYRTPVEVLASIEMRPLSDNKWLRPEHFAPQLRSAVKGLGDARPGQDVMALLLATLCIGAARAQNLRTLDYARLPGATWQHVAGYFGFDLTEVQTQRMKAASTFNAKKPGQIFHADADDKRRGASLLTREFADDIVAPYLRAALACLRPLIAETMQSKAPVEMQRFFPVS